jgi:hypothetical protein
LPRLNRRPGLYRAATVLTHYRGFKLPEGKRFNEYIQKISNHPNFKATCSTEQLYLDSYERFAASPVGPWAYQSKMLMNAP